MNISSVAATAAFLLFLTAGNLSAADISGVWTKTTSEDANNVTVFYQEGSDVSAVGAGRIAGRRAVWRASGSIDGNRIRLVYQYSADSVPGGWDPDGTMTLTLSRDGTRIKGTAVSKSGGWSGPVAWKRIWVVQPADN